ncbi:MAG: hypothetical protein SGI94_00900, partial [Saprospiraceae bacterium]|nr:hypothetical protein [Saprospiraceae bacterium]
GEVERLFQRYFLQTFDLSEVVWQKAFQSGWIVTRNFIARWSVSVFKLKGRINMAVAKAAVWAAWVIKKIACLSCNCTAFPLIRQNTII